MSTPQRPPAGFNHDHATAPDYEITVRFSATIPDLNLSIVSSQHATTSTLKQLIRASLPEELKFRRIRLIHAGKALPDSAALSTSLKRLTSHPPSRVDTPNSSSDVESHKQNGMSKGVSKGKEPVRDPPVQTRIYVHCSIGDIVLTPDELAAEAVLASTVSRDSNDDITVRAHGGAVDSLWQHQEGSATTPAPRGFDRLLSAGFTASEVQSLRMQFMAIQAHTHTPDTMPSPEELRNLEDRWLDNSNSSGGLDGMGGAGTLDEDATSASLDDMLYGAAMGFFWPIGCMFWGMREEGIWSQRRKMAIGVGIILNIAIGLIRWTS